MLMNRVVLRISGHFHGTPGLLKNMRTEAALSCCRRPLLSLDSFAVAPFPFSHRKELLRSRQFRTAMAPVSGKERDART